jgi:hypothetical protein
VGCLVTKDLVQAVEILSFGTLLQSTHIVVHTQIGNNCHTVLSLSECTHDSWVPTFWTENSKKEWEGGRGELVVASHKVDSNLVMYFDHNQNHVGRADCVSPMVSISVISDAGRMSHIVCNFFICFMVFTVVYSDICYFTHCKLFPLFLTIYFTLLTD